MNEIIENLRQPSTWRGLVWILAACGVVVSPEGANAIMAAGAATAGVVGAFVKD